MEEIDQAKVGRATRKRLFTRKCTLFEEAVSAEHPHETIEKALEQLCLAYTEVEGQHERYVELLHKKKTSEEDLQEEDEYILELERRRNHAQVVFSKIPKEVDTNVKP